MSKMAFKFIVLAAFVALATAEGPAAYDIDTLAIDHNGIGYSKESTQKSYGGQNVISAYSRGEDSVYSTVRVSNSHVGNDGLLQPAYGYGYNYAAPALAKPLIAQPVIAKAAYAAPATYAAHPAPVFAKAAYAAAPAYSYASPLLAKTYAAPAYGYASPLLAKTYAAPAYGYASPLLAKTYAAPAPLIAKPAYAYAAPAPLVAKPAYAYAAPAPLIAKPAYAYAAPAPLIAKAAYAATPIAAAPSTLAYAAHAPLIAKTYAAPYSYETAAPVVHAAFSGFGTSYSW